MTSSLLNPKQSNHIFSMPPTFNPPSRSAKSPTTNSESTSPRTASDPKTPPKYVTTAPPPPPPPESGDFGPQQLDVNPDLIDLEVFGQIVELDEEDETREFSRGMVFAFFAQAVKTLDEMDDALKVRDLVELSRLGHFLKGSSAQLGVRELKSSCAEIQLYGSLKEEAGTRTVPINPDEALKRIRPLVSQARKEYQSAETELRRWYDEVPTDVDAP